MTKEIVISTKQTNDQQPTALAPQEADTQWLNYFRPDDAYRDFLADVANMPSSKTEEKHTWRVYGPGLQYFLDRHAQQLPTKSLITQYITHLRHEKKWARGVGLSVSTIGSKYLAPLRKYLDYLVSQSITRRVDGSPLTNQDRNYIDDARQQIRAALNVKTPKPENTSNLAPLYQHGERLTTSQIQQLYDTCDVSTLAGIRDLALLYTGFTTGMRVAELQRMTLNKIRKAESCYLIHVRRKRGNTDPIPLDPRVYQVILAYIRRFNAAVEADAAQNAVVATDNQNEAAADPRLIDGDTPIWQGIQHNDTPFPFMYRGRDMHAAGMSATAIRGILKNRAGQAGGDLSDFPTFTPHDMRRSVAAMGHAAGMGIPEIQTLLGHKNGGVTLNYIGKPPQPEKSLITNLPGINWHLPDLSEPAAQSA